MNSSDGSRTLSRSLSLLRIVAADAPRPKKLAEIAGETGLHRATAHRLLSALIGEGLVEAVAAGYVVGPTCWSLGQAAEQRFNIVEIVRPSLQRIADETHDVGLFSVRIGDFTRCIERIEGDHPVLPTNVKPGSVRPLGVGAHSLAQLSALDDAEIRQILSRTTRERAGGNYSAYTDAYLLAKVAETRSQGFATSEGEIVAGWGALALPVRDRWGKLFGAISFVAVTDRLLPRRPALLAQLEEERRRVEAALGGPPDAAAGPNTYAAVIPPRSAPLRDAALAVEA